MLKFVNQLDSIFILLPMEEKAEGNFMLYGLHFHSTDVWKYLIQKPMNSTNKKPPNTTFTTKRNFSQVQHSSHKRLKYLRLDAKVLADGEGWIEFSSSCFSNCLILLRAKNSSSLTCVYFKKVSVACYNHKLEGI